MANKKKLTKAQEELEAQIEAAFVNQDMEIHPVDLNIEMRKSFMDYSMSVITDRALPDVRDGLKPVHRRIIYSMFDQGFLPDKPYRKCATTVGDVLGRFHPHGDAAVYDALVRLAQNFSMRYPLVDGHGNFGSRDGDAAAAYRYTEARLQNISLELLRDIKKNTVDFQPNFDEHVMEPNVLPASYPNLLVNGSSGIAVGMTTYIPPHNLGETIDAAVALLHNPEISLTELMTHIQGPDFPTYGIIMGKKGIYDTYRTGRGTIVVRAHCEIKEQERGKMIILVSDLPYQINKAELIANLAQQVKDKRIEGISNVRDESDRNQDIRIVIELKKEATPAVVLNQLYKYTALQTNIHAIMLALVPEKEGDEVRFVPRLLSLKQMLAHYLRHAEEVLSRRTQFDLDKAEARLHILEGLQKAIDKIDLVIDLIRHSETEALAKQRLQEQIGLTEIQAQSVVDMRLGRLSGLERQKILEERAAVEASIVEFTAILTDKDRMVETLTAEMLQVKEKYQDERRTVLGPSFEEVEDESLIENEPIVITLSKEGYIKRMQLSDYQIQHRGGRGIEAMKTREADIVDNVYTAMSHDTILFFSDAGKVYLLKAYQLPQSSRQAKGTALINLLSLETDEKITGLIPLSNLEEEHVDLAMITEQGRMKRTSLREFMNIRKSGLIALRLKPGDRLIAIRKCRDDDEVVVVTHRGQGIRFGASDTMQVGRNAAGIRAIRLAPDDFVIGMVTVPASKGDPEEMEEDQAPCLVTITEHGYGKRTPIHAFNLQKRGGKGSLIHRLSERTGNIVCANLVDSSNRIILISETGNIIAIEAEEVPILGRVTMGVKIMKNRDATVVEMCVLPSEAELDAIREKAAEQALAVAKGKSSEPGQVDEPADNEPYQDLSLVDEFDDDLPADMDDDMGDDEIDLGDDEDDLGD